MGVHLKDLAILFQASVTCVFWKEQKNKKNKNIYSRCIAKTLRWHTKINSLAGVKVVLK